MTRAFLKKNGILIKEHDFDDRLYKYSVSL